MGARRPQLDRFNAALTLFLFVFVFAAIPPCFRCRYATSGTKQGLVSELGHRLGWLNIFNPMHCDGFYRLDLGKRDQRMVAQMLVVLSIEEPGENVGSMRGCVYCCRCDAWLCLLRCIRTIMLVTIGHADNFVVYTRFSSTRFQWLRETYNGHGFELPQSWTQCASRTGKKHERLFFAGTFQKQES